MSKYNDEEKAFDSRTIIAIVLMLAIFMGGTAIQNYFFPKPSVEVAKEQNTKTEQAKPSATLTETKVVDVATVTVPLENNESLLPQNLPTQELTTSISTKAITAVFSNKGGNLISLKLNEHLDNKLPVEIIMPVDGKSNSLSLAFGDKNSQAIDAFMIMTQPSAKSILFERPFVMKSSDGVAKVVVLKKLYEFTDDEYMFKLSVSFESKDGLNFTGGEFLYTLSTGLQIGPEYKNLPANADWRKIITYENAKRKNIKDGVQTVDNSQATWAAVAGKYFAYIVLPETKGMKHTYTSAAKSGYPEIAEMSFSRQQVNTSTQTDVYYIYAGPKKSKELARYDDPTANSFKLMSTDLEAVTEGSNILAWLELSLKWLLNIFYGLVSNYGIAIILLTLLVRLLLMPLTLKSSKSSAKMQELQPKLQEIQAKYKNNPQKLNQEIALFYKTVGFNPLGGCWPMLIQFPIFIAMYSLFNNHFDLRGAMFISGWINDLSLPESVYNFPTINLVIWQISAIRILPIVYVLSQLLYGKFMQQPGGTTQQAGQMKFMMYGMPIIFFFILYNVPAGLLVYWISSNVFSILQQVIVNKYMKKVKADNVAQPEAYKIVPSKSNKKIKK